MEHLSPPTADGRPPLPAGVLPLEVDDPIAIGGHRLVGRLGSGGMGVVYLGWTRDGALAAVKTALPEGADDAGVRRRYQSEVACARKAPPDCTARVLVDGTAETPPYIVTEYLQGPSLVQVIEARGPLPPERLRGFAAGVARALAAIHAAGLVHRDLKPANVLLTADGPRVIDFGIAQQVAAAGGLTRAGVVMGSPGWIPPERLAGGPAAAASDVFGWGCLVCYAATGRNPFGMGDADELARRVLHEPPDLRGVPEPLRRLVAAALAKNPADRPAAAALSGRLRRRMAGRIGAAVPAGAHRAGVRSLRPLRPVARRMASAVVAVSAAIAVVLAVSALDDGGGDPGTGGGPSQPSGRPTTGPVRESAPGPRAHAPAVPSRMPGRTTADRTPGGTPTGTYGSPPPYDATQPVAAPSPVTAPTQTHGTGPGAGNGVGSGNGMGTGNGKGNGTGSASGKGKGR